MTTEINQNNQLSNNNTQIFKYDITNFSCKHVFYIMSHVDATYHDYFKIGKAERDDDETNEDFINRISVNYKIHYVLYVKDIDVIDTVLSLFKKRFTRNLVLQTEDWIENISINVMSDFVKSMVNLSRIKHYENIIDPVIKEHRQRS